jgi:hypothetical protein
MEGGAYPETNMQEGYRKTIEPDTWKSKFQVTQEMVEDAKLFDIKAAGKDFMTSYTRTREKFGASILNNASASTMTIGGKSFDITGADGMPLFSQAHPSKTGGAGNQSNFFNLAFSYDNLCKLEEYMQKLTDDDGNLLNIQPDTIIIPNNAAIKKLVADVVFTDAGAPLGNNNHSFNFNYDRWNVIVWNQLQNPAGASSDAWYVMDSSRNQIDGLMWIDRIALNVKSDIDNETDNNVFRGRARFGAGVNRWLSMAGSWGGAY